jgi:hypothetical protein
MFGGWGVKPWVVRVALVLVFGALSLALFTRDAWLPGNGPGRFQGRSLDRGAWLALGLTLYNLLRLLMTRQAARGSGPSFRERLQARRRTPNSGGEGNPEYNPELDFTRPADPPV